MNTHTLNTIQASLAQASDTQTVTISKKQYDYLIDKAAAEQEFCSMFNNQLRTAQAAVLKSLETENPLDCFNAMKNALSVKNDLDTVLDAHADKISANSFIKARLMRHPLHPECIKKVETELAKLSSEKAA